MKIAALLIGDMALFGDAGPGPILIPLAGSAVIAGIFLSLAIITGGVWLVRWSQNWPAFSWRKIFLVSLGGAFCFAAVVPGFLSVFNPLFLVVALALLVLGVGAVILGFRSPAEQEPAKTAEQKHSEGIVTPDS